MVCRWGVHSSARTGTCRGFTLVEILVALAVISVATTVAVYGFSESMRLSEINRWNKVAAGLAEEQMTDLLRNPSEYTWPTSDALRGGKLVQVTAVQEQTAGFDPPGAMPFDDRMKRNESNLYSLMKWEAYAKLPDKNPNAGYLEVTVVVQGEHRNRVTRFMLTSAIPRAAVEGTA